VLVNWPSIRDILVLYTRAQSVIFVFLKCC